MEIDTIRQPVAAGTFYPAEFTQLQEMLKECFESERGPGDLPVSKRTKKVLGIVAPHAGYPYSGAAAAWAYKEIAEAEFPDLYIILGVNHSSPKTCSSNRDWKTPFGTVRTDIPFVRTLMENGIPIDNEQHEREHSIEVQLPFLQFVSKDALPRLKIAAIMIGDENYKEHAEKIRQTIEKLNKKVVIIASGDFTHYGTRYGYVPFSIDVAKNMKKFDMEAASFIKNMDADGFINFIGYNSGTICGKHPIPVMIELLRDEMPTVELLHYYTSGEVTGDYKNCVGYAGIVIREN